MSHPRRSTLALAILSLAASPATAELRDLPDFSGHWVLDARTAPREVAPDGREATAGRPPRRTERPVDARRPSGGDALPRAERERLAALARAAERLEIRREGTGFTVEDALGRVWPAPADGSERPIESADGSVTYVRSEWGEWEGLRLWRVRAGEPTVQETFTLAPGGDELLVETTFPGAPWSAAPILRRYRRAPGPTPPG